MTKQHRELPPMQSGGTTMQLEPAMPLTPEQQEAVKEFASALIADSNLSRFMNELICCGGADCGCRGADVQSYIKYQSGIWP